MARPPMSEAQEKQRIVLSVLRGECSDGEAALRNKCSETSTGPRAGLERSEPALDELVALLREGPSAAPRWQVAGPSRWWRP